MNFKNIGSALLPVVFAFAASSANATVVTVFDTPAAGLATFNATVAAANGTAEHDKLTTIVPGTTVNRADYSIKRNNGGVVSGDPYGTMTGLGININPAGTPGIGAIGSGVTLTFNSGINAIGFEVGDWGTCCQPSALYISFDGGAPIQVGVSTTPGDVIFNGRAEVFVAAFDDTATFTKVQFWGDGVGEYLLFGGTIHYATLDEGTLPPNPVPEPASLALLGLGLIGLNVARRRKQK